MSRINIAKMSLDILMVVVFVLLINTRVITGLSFHETAGLVIGLAFIIHKVINWRWIKKVTLNIFGVSLGVKTRLGYIVDVLLFIAMGYIIISGILISKVLFPTLRFGNEFFFRNTHMLAAQITLFLLGIHIGLHWRWAMNTFKGILGISGEKRILKYIAKAAAILLLIVGGYSIYSTNYFAKMKA